MSVLVVAGRVDSGGGVFGGGRVVLGGRGTVGLWRCLWITDDRFLEHDTGRAHPERPAWLRAVVEGVRQADIGDALVPAEPRMATNEELLSAQLVTNRMIDRQITNAGPLDPDAFWPSADVISGSRWPGTRGGPRQP